MNYLILVVSRIVSTIMWRLIKILHFGSHNDRRRKKACNEIRWENDNEFQRNVDHVRQSWLSAAVEMWSESLDPDEHGARSTVRFSSQCCVFSLSPSPSFASFHLSPKARLSSTGSFFSLSLSWFAWSSKFSRKCSDSVRILVRIFGLNDRIHQVCLVQLVKYITPVTCKV